MVKFHLTSGVTAPLIIHILEAVMGFPKLPELHPLIVEAVRATAFSEDSELVLRAEIMAVLELPDTTLSQLVRATGAPRTTIGNQRYPKSHYLRLKEFAGGQRVSSGIAWLFALQYGYDQLDLNARHQIRNWCDGLVEQGYLLTATQTEASLRIGTMTLQRWCHSGRICCAHLTGYRRYFLPYLVGVAGGGSSDRLAVGEAAAWLGTSVRSLESARDNGVIQARRGAGGQWRYSIADLNRHKHLLEHQTKVTAGQFAARLGVSEEQITRWYKGGWIEGIEFEGKLRFDESEVTRVAKLYPKAKINPGFEWLHTFLVKARGPHKRLAPERAHRRLRMNQKTLKRAGSAGLLPFYTSCFQTRKDENDMPREYPEAYLLGLRRHAGGRRLSQASLRKYKERCEAAGRIV